MAWPVRKRSDGVAGGGGDVGDSSEETEMKALITTHGHQDDHDNTNTNDNYSQTAQPNSGNIPSPTSGIHTILNDGINRTILPSDATVLRHRHHYNNSQRPGANHQQSQSQPMQSSQSWDIYGRHSLDDADVAAGALSMIQSPSHQQHERPTIIRGRSSSSSGVTRSLSNPQPSPMKSSTLNSMGSKTPQSGRLQGVNDMIMHPFFSSPNKNKGSNGSSNNNNSSYDVHSNQFFNNSMQQQPQPIQMERGIGSYYSGRKNLKNAYYGGSEHDFLRLSAYDNETSSTSSSAQQQQQQYASQNQQHQYYSSSQRREMPVMPPLEITTNQQQRSNSTASSSSSSYPPYGLPIADERTNVRRKNVNAISDVQNYSPSSSISPSKLLLLPISSTNNNGTMTISSSSKFIVLGINLSSYTRQSQFILSASGTFMFSLLYGYLQELISVTLCHRQLGLFLALMQFSGYTILSYFFRNLGSSSNDDAMQLSTTSGGGVSHGQQQVVGLIKRESSGSSTQHQANMSFSRRLRRWKNWGKRRGEQTSSSSTPNTSTTVPLELYIGLSILRAIDLGMTNLAMQYVNYPTKTLMKSTRVIFTMIFGNSS